MRVRAKHLIKYNGEYFSPGKVLDVESRWADIFIRDGHAVSTADEVSDPDPSLPSTEELIGSQEFLQKESARGKSKKR